MGSDFHHYEAPPSSKKNISQLPLECLEGKNTSVALIPCRSINMSLAYALTYCGHQPFQGTTITVHRTYLLVVSCAFKKLNRSLSDQYNVITIHSIYRILHPLGVLGGLTIWVAHLQRDLQNQPSVSVAHVCTRARVHPGYFMRSRPSPSTEVRAHTQNTDPKCVCGWTGTAKSGGLRLWLQFTDTNSSLSRTALFFTILFVSASEAFQR